MQILLKTLTGKTIPLNVEPSTTIECLKSQIQNHLEGNPFSHLEVFFVKRPLENDHVISDYNIQEGSVLHLLNNYLQIFVKTTSGETISLDVNASDTIETVQSMISHKASIPADKMGTLYFGEKQLKKGSKLSDYNIQNASTLVLGSNERMKLFVKTDAKGNILKSESDPVRKLKSLVGSQPDRQRLIFNAKQLDDRTSSSCDNIQNVSTIHFMPSFRVLVKTIEGKTLSFNMEPYDTIESLKCKIHEQEGIPVDCQRLFFRQDNTKKSKVLTDTNTFNDYKIASGSTLFLVKYVQPRMQIFVETPTGKSLTLEVQHSDSIETIKSYIQGKEGIPPEKQRLYCNRVELKDRHSLAECNIQKHSTLQLKMVSTELTDDSLKGSALPIALKETDVDVTYCNKTIALKVKASDTVGHIKTLAKKSFPTAPNKQALYLDGKQLQDDHAMSHYNTQKKIALQLRNDQLYSVRLYRNLSSKGSVSAVFCVCLLHPLHMQQCDKVISAEYSGMTDKGEGRTVTNSVEIMGDVISLQSNYTPGCKISFDKKPAQIRKADIDEGIDKDPSQLSDYPPRLVIYVKQQGGYSSDPFLPEVTVTGLNKELILAELPTVSSETSLSSLSTNSVATLTSDLDEPKSPIPELVKPPLRLDDAALSTQTINDIISNEGFEAIKECRHELDDYKNCSILMAAGLQGKHKVARHILKKAAKVGKKEIAILLNQQDREGWSPIIFACAKGHYKVAKLLLKRGADVNQQDSQGKSALMFASAAGHSEVVELLLERGAWVNLQDKQGQSALMLACDGGHTESAELLLSKHAQVDLQDKQGLTALMHSVKNSQFDTTKLLLDHEADVDQQSHQWDSALSIAFSLERWSPALGNLLQERIRQIPAVKCPATDDFTVNWQEVKLPLMNKTLLLFKFTDEDGYCRSFRLVSMISANWRNVGITFLNYDENQLNVLDEKRCGDPISCCWEIIREWMKRQSASWQELHQLLRDANCNDEARKLKKALSMAIYHPPSLHPVRGVVAEPVQLPPDHNDSSSDEEEEGPKAETEVQEAQDTFCDPMVEFPQPSPVAPVLEQVGDELDAQDRRNTRCFML